MSDWLSALRAAPSPPDELLEFAATQPSLAATWLNATRPDWLIWMAANGFAGDNSPRDLVSAVAIFADYARRPTWRLALRLHADDEDVVRRLVAETGDFDLSQLVGHVYLGCAIGTVAGMALYWRLAGHSLVVRELAGGALLVAIAVVVSFVAFRIFSASLSRLAAHASVERAAPTALEVATRVVRRSDVMKQMYGAKLVRKRLAGPVA